MGLRCWRGPIRIAACPTGGSSLAALIAAAASGAPALAQQSPATQAAPADKASPEIVISGRRRIGVLSDADPIASFDSRLIEASGATTIDEFLRTVRAVTQSANGAAPVFLLNGQRVSGYEEIGSLPPEAIERVDVLPEPVALNYGYPPNQRVLNFITKRRFRQLELRGDVGTTTRGGNQVANGIAGLTRLHGDARLTLGLEVRHIEPLLTAQRRIDPDPAVPFDAIGNIVGTGGGAIDPALSAAAGTTVSIAPVPADPALRGSLLAYAAAANQSRPFDVGPYRTLVQGTDARKANAVLANRIGKTLAGSITLTAEQVRNRSLLGPANAMLLVPAGNPFSPFTQPVVLDRYLTEAAALRQRGQTTTLHAGALLRGALGGWRWDATATLDQKQTTGFVETGIDPAAANAAFAAGTDPFAPLAPALLAARLVDHARQRTRTAAAKLVATAMPLRLPAGGVTVTASAEAQRQDTVARTIGPDASALALGRARSEGSLALDLPIAARDAGVLPFLGTLSANASVTLRRVGGFGTLHDSTLGTTWTPVASVQLIGLIKRSAAAPGIEQLASPRVRVANVPIFDFATGDTVLVTLTQGGNPALAAEHRLVRSIALNLKPFARRELHLGITYEATTVHDQTGTIYALTAQTEAILPDLFVHDAAGRLVSVAFQPTNYDRQEERTLNLTLAGSGTIGKPTAAPPPAGAKPPAQTFFYGGIGPSLRFVDRLWLRPGAPALNLLDGGTVAGSGTARAFGYAYGGLGRQGNGASFNLWYSGGGRVSGATPDADLRFSPIFRLTMSVFASVHHFLPHEDWTKRVQLKLDVNNLTDNHQRVVDGRGFTPNRFQPDYLEPAGRSISLTLRKLIQ